MKRVIIRNLDGVLTHGAEMEAPESWIESCVAQNVWGNAERPEIGEDGEPTGNILPAEYTIEVQDVTAEHELAACLAKRKAEYPSAEEFLNAYFDGGDSAVQALNQIRLAVKAKYPKPVA